MPACETGAWFSSASFGLVDQGRERDHFRGPRRLKGLRPLFGAHFCPQVFRNRKVMKPAVQGLEAGIAHVLGPAVGEKNLMAELRTVNQKIGAGWTADLV